MLGPRQWLAKVSTPPPLWPQPLPPPPPPPLPRHRWVLQEEVSAVFIGEQLAMVGHTR